MLTALFAAMLLLAYMLISIPLQIRRDKRRMKMEEEQREYELQEMEMRAQIRRAGRR